MFQIFKLELLDGVELAVQSHINFRKNKKDSFLDIEVDPLAYLSKWTKSTDRYLFPQQNLFVTKDIVKLQTGQSSKGESSQSAKRKGIVTEKVATAKEKANESKDKGTVFIDIYQDAQQPDESEWESKYLEMLYSKSSSSPSEYPSDFEPGEQEDSDRSPKGPW